LRQVFSILIDNALRYSNAGGKVGVTLKRNSKEIVGTIHDTGIGLTKEEARQAFQRFSGGNKAQGHAGGTGLGLPVAKAIIGAHNGSIYSMDCETRRTCSCGYPGCVCNEAANLCISWVKGSYGAHRQYFSAQLAAFWLIFVILAALPALIRPRFASHPSISAVHPA